MAGRTPQVQSADIAALQLLNPRPWFLHLYICPYLILYPLATYAYLFKYEDWLHEEQANTFLLCLSVGGTQALAWLGTKWNASYRTFASCVKASSLKEASLVRVIAAKDKGTGDIVPLARSRRPGEQPIVHFTYQRDKYLYNPQTNTFAKLSYPVDRTEPSKPTLGEFKQSQGLETSHKVNLTQSNYGKNAFDIPVPSFTELFGEHAVAPFFVFQIFCVGLWCLDEYWYYSLFTLFMLVVFECTVVFQRQRTLAEFRTMSIKPFAIQVFRAGQWFAVQSDDLLPGDLCSITRTSEDSGLPCDLLLVQGTCIVNEAMLSGESTPLLKESVELRKESDLLDSQGADKNSILFGGTKVLQSDGSSAAQRQAAADDGNLAAPAAKGVHPSRITPDGGCLAVVLRTGFGTSQGQLVRTMIFSTERVTANNLESFLFIGFLLIFAIVASAYVWIKGVEAGRPKMKLLLDCVIILTSVVPPELPMELSLAVNTSLAALSKFAIFCTEPFRIPLAGRVDVCCFDKTGTLTGEDLIVEGIAGISGVDPKTLTQTVDTSLETTLTLATSHALVMLEEAGIVGDPMEKTTLESIGWTLYKGDRIAPCPPSAPRKPPRRIAAPVKKGKAAAAPVVEEVAKPDEPPPMSPHQVSDIAIRRRFQFSSALKRMSTVSLVKQTPQDKARAFASVKGAPETLKAMFTVVPPEYESTYKYYAQKGSRVLALGYKWLDGVSPEKITKLTRDQVESGLTFAGFLVFHCPLKPDAIETIQALNDSSHRSIMITGDNPLTAVSVAQQVEIVDRDTLIIDQREGSNIETDLVWRTPDDSKVVALDPNQPLDTSLLKDYDICMTGAAVKQFTDKPEAWNQLVQHTWVYARVSPAQKEFIIGSLKDLDYITLMAGDGTNDVGALKRAHIGVALLNGSEEALKELAENQKIERVKKVYEAQLKMTSRFGQAPPPVPQPIAHLYPDVVAAQKVAAAQHNNARSSAREPPKFDMSSLMDKFSEMDEGQDGPPAIKLGDASVAAPFTSKLSNTGAITNIIRQGRCTLVATTQMYKILALNCLISAYSLSVMYLDGIKFGDYQVTITGMLMSVCFLCISRAKPIEKLSKQRPLGNIFNFYVLLSVLAQFAIHIASLVYISQLCEQLDPRTEKVDLEKEFHPGLLNSAVYLVSLIQQVSTFAINFIGRPFREGITENPALYYGLLGVAAIAINGVTNFQPEINEWLQLTDMSTTFRLTLGTAMAFDYFGCWAAEVVLRKVFAEKPVRELITRGDERREKRRQQEAEEKKKA